ncbi:hypothetical protein [Neoroseomonas lacus]|uniref:Uncharacterized protein n=1 Tax=Neoroseomonas lacus TaxID=287609 RepID=A0A917KQU1_9PROT|nr:hypothetical protein [Neoroseomonas lacus]GGJ20138.1 hypothetical protein GCM10011320_29320 [Neoroseomonas lacus]
MVTSIADAGMRPYRAGTVPAKPVFTWQKIMRDEREERITGLWDTAGAIDDAAWLALLGASGWFPRRLLNLVCHLSQPRSRAVAGYYTLDATVNDPRLLTQMGAYGQLTR